MLIFCLSAVKLILEIHSKLIWRKKISLCKNKISKIILGRSSDADMWSAVRLQIKELNRFSIKQCELF